MGIWILARSEGPLWRVDLRGDALVVSRWRREVVIPLTEVRAVRWRSERTRDSAGLVVIELRSDRARGHDIFFVPKSAADVDELRALVTNATGVPQSG